MCVREREADRHTERQTHFIVSPSRVGGGGGGGGQEVENTTEARGGKTRGYGQGQILFWIKCKKPNKRKKNMGMN